MTNGLDMHNEIANVDTITVLLSSTSVPSIKMRSNSHDSSSTTGSGIGSFADHSLQHLPYENLGMGVAHFLAMCKTDGRIHLTGEERAKFLLESRQIMSKSVGFSTSAIMKALLGVLSGLDFIFKLGDVVSKVFSICRHFQ